MTQPEPQLIVHHVDDLEWHEVRSQQIGDRRTSVWNRFVDITDDRTVAYTRYDAGVMLPRHSHHADEVIYIIEGEVTVGDQSWKLWFSIFPHSDVFVIKHTSLNSDITHHHFTTKSSPRQQNMAGLLAKERNS